MLHTEQGYQYAPYVPPQEGAPPGYYDNPASGTGYAPASGNGYYNQMSAPSTMYCPPSGQPIAVPPTTTILMTQPYNQMSPNIKVSIRLQHKRFPIKLRIPAMYEANTAQNSNFWMFWSITL